MRCRLVPDRAALRWLADARPAVALWQVEDRCAEPWAVVRMLRRVSLGWFWGRDQRLAARNVLRPELPGTLLPVWAAPCVRFLALRVSWWRMRLE
jgi:hypothetical protein